ncbi:hypothetical protein SteCoe_28686 [Stentor coeruleus]|uniref:CHCH domain-containing protein n=1 Tax=Stentor coeruleus TaxID=5963 RepID=A0A1R2B7S2_9CILI|nr:hypothetical protein SteCoe_28686 [Stentor coeruleus]
MVRGPGGRNKKVFLTDQFSRGKATRVPCSHKFPSSQYQNIPGMINVNKSNLTQGIAFGTGSEIGNQTTNKIIRSDKDHNIEIPQPIPQTFNEACYQENQNFMICLQLNNSDICMCQNYLDLFKECKGKF